MADILSVGARSLISIQRALNTTGHNISNANTEGYSRQNVNITSVEAQRLGFGYLGQGSNVESIQRSYDGFLSNQVRTFTASHSHSEMFASLGARVDDILASSSNSLGSSIQKFFSALQDVANNPSSLPERQVLLGQASSLLDRQQSLANVFNDLNQEVNSHLRTTVAEINNIAGQIASLNKEIISSGLSADGSTPNDLLDKRDRLLQDISEKVEVNIIESKDGVVSVFVGGSQSLVVGAEVTVLQTQNNQYDSAKLEIGLEGQSGVVAITNFIKGGELEGLIDFRKRILDPVQEKLGLVMLGLSETTNSQHRLGLDLDGNAGVDFFQVGAIKVNGNTYNSGTAAPVVALNDVTQLQASEYQLDYDGIQWQLLRLSDNTSVSGPGPLVLDGMSVDVSAGVPGNGDSFRFNPAKGAANSVQLGLLDPRKVAAAAQVAGNIDSGNTGNAVLGGLLVSEPNTLPLAGPITLTYNPDALGAGLPGFDVTGGPGGTLAYDPATEASGKVFSFAAEGLSFTLSGIPDAGDSFQVSNNAGAPGDNSNLLQMIDLQHQRLLNNGQESYQDLYAGLVVDVGVINQQSSSNLEVESVLLEQASRYRDNVTGVNLDEEATNMIRYQQQYQAAAQLIKVADQMFQTLLLSIGR